MNQEPSCTMTRDEFAKRLATIVDTAYEQTRVLLNDANPNPGQPFWYEDGSMGTPWDSKADAFAELCGAIYDRVNGKRHDDRKSTRRKLRKVLGYTYP